MKIRFTDVTTEPEGGQLKGLSAYYEASDSDGLGNVGIDSGGISPTDSYPVFYADVATLESRTQTQLYNDFYPKQVVQVIVGYELDLEGEEVDPIYQAEPVGEAWLRDIQEVLDINIEIDKQSKNPTIEIIDNIADQTPINIGIMDPSTGGGGGNIGGGNANGVQDNMQQYVGDSWDGSTSGVTMITSWETMNGTTPPGAPASWDGDIGPGGAHPARGNTWRFKLPHNGEVYSAKYSFNRGVHGFIQLNIVPSSDHSWHPNYVTVVWMSSTPGGDPHVGYDGNPHMFKFSNETARHFGTYYDRDLISDGAGLSEREGIITTAFGAEALRQTRAPYGGLTWQSSNLSSGGDYVFPVIEKTYFLNWAMVLATKVSTVLERGTPPTASERKPLVGLSNQYGLISMNGSYDTGNTSKHSLSNYLDVTHIQTPSSNQIYVGTDTTMYDFIWDPSSSFLSNSAYTPIGSGDITTVSVTKINTAETFSDVGFEAEGRYHSSSNTAKWYLESEEERVIYDIPKDGKLATIDFTMALSGYGYVLTDQKNSIWELMWTPHSDNTTRAWYDLGLTPVMWISPEPGGEPQPTYDFGKGVVVAIESSGSTYYGQHLVSTAEVQSMTANASETRATFPISRHTNYLNVGVVETAVAQQLVSDGVAPTASQLRSWSTSDPSLTYTPSSSQVMYLNGKRQTVDISPLSRSIHFIGDLES